MIVFAFDRDLTVDSSPHPGPIPLKWVRFLARKTACEVWAVGNQALRDEAGIPGLVELRARLELPEKKAGAAFEDRNNALDKRAQNVSGKHTRLRFLHRAFPDAARYICTDDYAEVGHVGPPWEFYLPQDFVAAWPEIRVAATAVACPLCERRPVMPVHYEDELVWVTDCKGCRVPMIVWKPHVDGSAIDGDEKAYCRRVLADLFPERVYDDAMHAVPWHYHAHAR